MRNSILGLMCCAIMACSTTKNYSDFSNIPGTIPVTIAVKDIDVSYAHQMVQGTINEKPQTLQVVIEKVDDELVFVALSSSGFELYRIVYDGESIELTLSDLLDVEINPWQVVSDFLVMFGPSELLQHKLKTQQWTFNIEGNTKSVIDPLGNAVVSARCLPRCEQHGQIDNHTLKYKILIKSLVYEKR